MRIGKTLSGNRLIYKQHVHVMFMKRLIALIVAALLLTSIAAAHFYRTFNPQIDIHQWPYKKKMVFVITCDDISSGYPHEYFEEILDTFEKYGVKCTFFVIPYHGEWDLLTESPSFVTMLHTAEEKGHEIALHGYAHYTDEFVCSPDNQAQLLEKALAIMEDAGFEVKGFRAPCLKTTEETPEILKKYNFVYDSSTFGESGDVVYEGSLPEIPSGYEYTWYITEDELPEKLVQAKNDFLAQYKKGSVFSIVTHMKAVNEGSGIHFLEDFLSFVREEDVWNFTLLELVEWNQQQQEVKWESEKTLTGGDITFQNIPQGLAVAVRLPHYYSLKDVPPGVEVTTHADSDTQIFELVFLEDFVYITLSFGLTYASPVHNEAVILHQLRNLIS